MIEERYKPKEEEGFGTTLGGRKVDSPLLFIASTTYVERPHTPSIFFLTYLFRGTLFVLFERRNNWDGKKRGWIRESLEEIPTLCSRMLDVESYSLSFLLSVIMALVSDQFSSLDVLQFSLTDVEKNKGEKFMSMVTRAISFPTTYSNIYIY